MNKVLELVINVAVLAVLSAIAIPTLTCFPRRAQATVALFQMRQFQKQCILNRHQDILPEVFINRSMIFGYQFKTEGSDNCQGQGLFSAIPDNTNQMPIFYFSSDTGLLTYGFKGEIGNDFQHCLKLICSDSNSP